MGILDRLMFWRDNEADGGADGFEVEGCFTLPESPTGDTDPTTVADDGCDPAVGSIREQLEADDAADGEGDLLAEALEDPVDQIDDQLAVQSEALSRTLQGDDT